jgi:hypothetical protein
MTARQLTIWTAILAMTAVVGSYSLACVLPFAAIAAVAAITLPRRQAIAAVGATWAANQIIGFTMMDYANGANAYAWSGFIAFGAVAGLGAALLARGSTIVSWRTPLALVASVAAFQAVMFAGAVMLDGFASSTPEIVATIVRNDAIWFAGLLALWVMISRFASRRVISAQTA